MGKLRNILAWWNKTNTFGPKIESFPKAKVSWLIVNPEKYETAKLILKDTKLNITDIGKRNLGAVVGTKEYKYDQESKRIGNRIKVTV